MEARVTTIDVRKLQQLLGRAKIACLAAIEQGDAASVARFTCEVSRLTDCIVLAKSVRLENA